MVIHNPFSKIPLYWQVTLFIKNKMFLTYKLNILYQKKTNK